MTHEEGSSAPAGSQYRLQAPPPSSSSYRQDSEATDRRLRPGATGDAYRLGALMLRSLLCHAESDIVTPYLMPCR